MHAARPSSGSSSKFRIAFFVLLISFVLLSAALLSCYSSRMVSHSKVSTIKDTADHGHSNTDRHHNSIDDGAKQPSHQHQGDEDAADHHHNHHQEQEHSSNKIIHKPSRAISELRYRIVIFTYLRPAGLKRLLHSLLHSYYPAKETGIVISLAVLFDYPKSKDTGNKNKQQARQETIDMLKALRWPHGPLTLHRREGNVGLKRNILESWYPPGDDRELAVTFEDDIEVSPFWFEWVLAAADKYYLAQPEAMRRKLLGVSLFRPVHDELSRRKCVVSNGHQPFLLQQPCSWGAVYFPQTWRAFRDWYDEFEPSGAEPLVMTERGEEPDSNTWWKSSSWKKYLIKYMHEQGWAMVYPNLPDRLVLSTNHLMKGEHPLPRRNLFELPLLDDAAAGKMWPEDSARGKWMKVMRSSSSSSSSSLSAATTDDSNDSSSLHLVVAPPAERLFDLPGVGGVPPLESLRCFDVMFHEVQGGPHELMKTKKNMASTGGR